MLLRNAGHFAEFLIANGFHLVLHGHLHKWHCSQRLAFQGGDRLL